MTDLRTIDLNSGCYGAKWGPSDWYSEAEAAIAAALAEGRTSEWTTGWYGSKKEIVSARITSRNEQLEIGVSISDDFDTPGAGRRQIPHTQDLELIQKAISEAWEEAGEDQKDNQDYIGWTVLTEIDSYAVYSGGKPKGKPTRRQGWVETYIQPHNDGWMFDYPPGDNYHQWGFQGEHDIPEEIKQKLEAFIMEYVGGETDFTADGYTVKRWDESPE